jgi:NAD(P)H dehydrogenase (quinone)
MSDVKVNVIFHSIYGHNYAMAVAVAEGAKSVDGVDVGLYQVEETLPEEVLAKMNAVEAKKGFAEVPVATLDQLVEAQGLVFGVPTRFGMMSGQMRAFWDRTGELWQKGALFGKVGSVFASTATQHGGQEATILSFHTTLLHHGMIVVAPGYGDPVAMKVDEVSGGGPYGATTITGPDGSRMPSEGELSLAGFQGKLVAETAKKLFR